MPIPQNAVDPQGRPVTGITSALPAADAASYGDHVSNEVNISNIFPDIEDEAPAQSPNPALAQAQVQQPIAIEPGPVQDPEPKPQVPEPNIPEGNTVLPPIPEGGTVAVAQTPPTLQDGEEFVDIDEDEYKYLSELDKDGVIAFGVKHRKGNATLQRKYNQIQNVVGKTIISAIEENQDISGVSRLLQDLPDEAFQTHLTSFYESHERRGDKYVKVKDTSSVPAPDILKQYTELIQKRASLNILDFMDKDEEFNSNEAFTNPASPSGRALAKQNSELAKIEMELKTIEEKSVNGNGAQTPPAQNQEEVRKQNQRMWGEFTEAHSDLKQQDRLDEFQRFVAENQSKPLEVFYRAFQTNQTATKKLRRLVFKETSSIANNKQRGATQPVKAVQPQLKTDPNVDQNEAQLIKADQDYFGDTD